MSQHSSWYLTPLWRRRRSAQLRASPLCERCIALGVTRAATVANHNPRHGGDWQAFVNGPLESLCERCHNVNAQRGEARGYVVGCDMDGRPLSKRRGWS